MKKLISSSIRMCQLLSSLCLLVIISSCNNLDQSVITDVVVDGEEQAIELTDSWICDMKSFEDESWYYEMYLEESGDYVAISNSRILKVSKDGMLNTMILTTYPDNNPFLTRVYNDKIYRFHYDNDFQDFNPSAPIQLQIYDLDFNLLSDQVLDAVGLLYDVEIESDDVFGMLLYNVDDATMTLKKLSSSSGEIAEIVLSTNGTTPRNLHITETGEYYCTASSNKKNLTYLDNDLNLIWVKEFAQYTVGDAKYIPGRGFYITGRVTPSFNPERPSYVALVDINGILVNSVELDPSERWLPWMEVNQEKICLIQTEPESGRDMLFSIYDYDLNIESAIQIQGNVVQSDIIVNERGSFSFVYGIAVDPMDPEFFPVRNTRIFQFDETYELPTNIIIQ